MNYSELNELPLTLTVEEMGALLMLSRNCAYALARSKDFPTIRVGKTILICKDGLKDWLSTPKVISL